MAAADTPANDSQRLQWFSDLGFGLFIHWSMDSQLGAVIGHSMAGASKDYLRRFIEELPATFNPTAFDPRAWAVLAKLAGVRYVVFTTKHHSGFCMFHTSTTPFSISQTPFSGDITGEVIDAFRQQGIAIGLYFSPDDFHFLHGKGLPVHRGVLPEDCTGLLAHNQAQMRELLTNYGKIDILFFDGPSDGLRETCWEIDPEVVITRGAMPTPEQHIPGVQSAEPWEACVTMGTGWQYKPTNEQYKSGTQLLELLIETRAKGGNLLLNVGPKPNGELPIEQEALLREIALWNFVNGEAIAGVRPWRIPREGDVWFTAVPEESVVYAHIEGDTPWPQRTRREVSLYSVRTSTQSTVQVLGQADDLIAADGPAIEWSQREDRLHISVARMQRLYNNRKWPNPVVLKITDAQIGLVPPTVRTGAAQCRDAVDSDAQDRRPIWQLHAQLIDLGEEGAVEVGFEFRLRRLLTDRADEWQQTPLQQLQSAGDFGASIGALQRQSSYEFRAVVHHPSVTVYGDYVAFRTP
jgi:alpha-L-fucosidase